MGEGLGRSNMEGRQWRTDHPNRSPRYLGFLSGSTSVTTGADTGAATVGDTVVVGATVGAVLGATFSVGAVFGATGTAGATGVDGVTGAVTVAAIALPPVSVNRTSVDATNIDLHRNDMSDLRERIPEDDGRNDGLSDAARSDRGPSARPSLRRDLQHVAAQVGTNRIDL